MKFIPNAVTQTVGRNILKAQKHSPRLMFVAGVAGVVTSAVLACRATLKLEEKLEDGEKRIQDAVYTENKTTVVKAYVVTAGDILKLYAPSIVIGTASIGLLTSSHVVLSRRNATLTAAYGTLQTAFDEYRERVRHELGEEKEKDVYLGIVEETEIVDGKKQKVRTYDPNKLSMYARVFDEYNANWRKGEGYNMVFLRAQQNYLNDLLQVRGHVFLNEVYDALGMEHSSPGAVVGWVISDEGDNHIDFGIYEARNADFMAGHEPSIILDFNVDGVIYDKI